MRSPIIRFVLLVFTLVGILICGSWCLPFKRVAIGAFAMLVLWLSARSGKCEQLWKAMENYPMRMLVAFCLLGVAIRMVLIFTIGNTVMKFPDFTYFWEGSVALSHGMVYPMKSWVTNCFYAAIIKCFGENVEVGCLFNIVLHVATALLGFKVLQALGSVRAGVLYVAFLMLNPGLSTFSCAIASENIYLLLVMGILSFIVTRPGIESWRRAVFEAFVLGVMFWLCTWTRGEGIMFLAIIPTIVFLKSVQFEFKIRYATLFLLVFAVIFIGGSSFALWVNGRLTNDVTIFCSNDNLIPRYMGSNLSTNGEYDFSYKPHLVRTFEKRYPNETYRQIRYSHAAEIADFIKRETKANWSQMTLTTKMRFLFKKFRIDWWRDLVVGIGFAKKSFQAVFAFFPAIIVCLALCYFVRATRSLKVATFNVCLVLPLMCLACNVIILFVGEASLRYSVLMHLLLPVYASLFIDRIMSTKTYGSTVALKADDGSGSNVREGDANDPYKI